MVKTTADIRNVQSLARFVLPQYAKIFLGEPKIKFESHSASMKFHVAISRIAETIYYEILSPIYWEHPKERPAGVPETYCKDGKIFTVEEENDKNH